MRATGQATVADRAACRKTSGGWCGARDPRRMARRLGRRLAGLRRRVAGHQADRGRARAARAIPSSASAAAACCRQHTDSRATDDVSPATRAAAAGQPGARPRRHGAERRPDPGDGDREVPAALRGRVGRRGSRRSAFSTRSSARLQRGDVQAIGAATTRNFFGPIQTIIPWASNFYTETLIEQARARVRRRFLGLLDARRHVRRRHGLHLRAGAQGGGAGAPAGDHVATRSASCEHALPFAMEPVVYDFAINERGTFAELLRRRRGAAAAGLLRADGAAVAAARTRARCRRCAGPSWTASAPPAARKPELRGMVQTLFDRLLPRAEGGDGERRRRWTSCWSRTASIARSTSRSAPTCETGASAWRRTACPPSTDDRGRARRTDVIDATASGRCRRSAARARHCRRLRAGEVAVVTLAAGAGSRWTQGAGVVKALHPFCKLGGRHRTFIEMHLAKSRRIGATCRHAAAARLHHQLPDARADRAIPRRASRTTATPGRCCSRRAERSGCGWCRWCATCASPGRRCRSSCSTSRQQKVRESLHAALIGWARAGRRRRATTPTTCRCQCLHPVGHWYEVPNLLRNGVLARLLDERPQLKYLLLHNIDTLGADLDPALLGLHIAQRRVPDLRGDHAAHRGPRRRAGARGRPAAPGRRPGHAARGGRVRAVLLQLADDLDRHRPAAGACSA